LAPLAQLIFDDSQPAAANNLSVWDNLDSLKASSAGQNHLGSVLWWLHDDQQPSLVDAKRRLQHLKEHGESAYAFRLSKPFSMTEAILPTWYSQSILRLADNALIHAQRISEWCGHGPMLEEDIALANIGLDHLGQARMLLARAGQVEGKSRDEDDLAFWRDEHDFSNANLVELPNSSTYGLRDYAVTITKLYLHSQFMMLKWEQLLSSTDATVRAVANKAIKETRYHLEHAGQWMIRFGQGTTESKARAQSALNLIWRYTEELFADDAVDTQAAQAGLAGLNAPLKSPWLNQVQHLLNQAQLQLPPTTTFVSQGKQGKHTENLSHLLASMQSVARQHPGATW
jgi:ring-1,2-phenylacetyl-CoA epoxidase subunit PaaC